MHGLILEASIYVRQNQPGAVVRAVLPSQKRCLSVVELVAAAGYLF